jgi:CHASE2 domain-containing sensor protein
LALHNSPFMEDLQLANLDALFLSHSKLKGAAGIVIVQIAEDDYKNVFQRRSPLDPRKVAEIIADVARSHPSAIGVDLDTGEWTSQQRVAVRSRIAQTDAAAASTPIVWAASGVIDDAGKMDMQPLEGLARYDCAGVPAAQPDSQYFVREFYPSLDVTIEGTPTRVPSIAVLLGSVESGQVRACHVAEKWSEATQPEFMNFSGGAAGFQHFSAGLILNTPMNESWKTSNPLKGKTVLIGGIYPEARDRYPTPAGPMNGVDVLGETLLSARNGIAKTGAWLFVLADILIGFGLLTVTFFCESVSVSFLSFVVIPVIAMLASWIAFSRFGYFISFVPVMMGVFLHHLREHVREHRRMDKENREYKQSVRPHTVDAAGD